MVEFESGYSNIDLGQLKYFLVKNQIWWKPLDFYVIFKGKYKTRDNKLIAIIISLN